MFFYVLISQSPNRDKPAKQKSNNKQQKYSLLLDLTLIIYRFNASSLLISSLKTSTWTHPCLLYLSLTEENEQPPCSAPIKKLTSLIRIENRDGKDPSTLKIFCCLLPSFCAKAGFCWMVSNLRGFQLLTNGRSVPAIAFRLTGDTRGLVWRFLSY